MKLDLLLGAHVSTAGGLTNAIQEGTSLGCDTIQIFTKNNRQWAYKVFSTDEIEEFKKAQKESSIRIVVSHASYLINLGSPNKDVYTKSLKALSAELKRCEELNIPFIVLHPGAHLTNDISTSISQIANALDIVLKENICNTKILLENMAGQGTTIGSRFEELKEIYIQVTERERIGFCFDTCHAFAAGYNLTTKKSTEQTFDLFNSIIGLEKLHVLHLNDSKKDRGSHLDRHEWIGKGKIGLEAFSYIMNNENFTHIAKIIETPRETLDDHAENLRILRNLINKN